MKLLLHDLKKNILAPTPILSWVAGSILTAAIGPFGTYDSVPFYQRLIFWAVILFVALVVSEVIQKMICLLAPSWGIIKQTVLSCITFIFFYWFFIVATINRFYKDIAFPPPLVLLLIISGVTASIFVIIYLVAPEALQISTKTPQPETPSEPETQEEPCVEPISSRIFMRRLGPEAGTQLVRLAMRDHYIEAITNTGSKLVHMRFADALSEIADLNGGKIHRSHWVNFDEIIAVVKEGTRIGFRMSDGVIVPIARSQKTQLKKQGLI